MVRSGTSCRLTSVQGGVKGQEQSEETECYCAPTVRQAPGQVSHRPAQLQQPSLVSAARSPVSREVSKCTQITQVDAGSRP